MGRAPAILAKKSRNGLDNAVMENFFGVTKSECLYSNTFK